MDQKIPYDDYQLPVVFLPSYENPPAWIAPQELLAASSGLRQGVEISQLSWRWHRCHSMITGGHIISWAFPKLDPPYSHAITEESRFSAYPMYPCLWTRDLINTRNTAAIGYQTKNQVQVSVDNRGKIKEAVTSETKGEHYVMQLKALFRVHHPDYNNELTQFLPRTIVLKKPPGAQLGFNIRGGKASQLGIFISKVVPDSDAHRAGLQEGDQVLSVNEVDFQDIEHSRAVEILKTAREILMRVRFFPYNYQRQKERTVH